MMNQQSHPYITYICQCAVSISGWLELTLASLLYIARITVRTTHMPFFFFFF